MTSVSQIILGVPSRRADRWALLIVTVGWGLLAAFTFAGIAGRSGAGWAILAAVIAGITFAFYITGYRCLRKLSAASTIAFAIARSADYATDNTWGPLAVWMIVAGLALVAYRASVRHDGS